MLGLLLPLGLLGLLALAVPLLVHLARRSEAAVLDFAAMRWLRAAPRPRSRVRFDEVLLLLLRLLLVLLLALMLAQPVWREADDRRAVVAVVPGVDLVEARAAVFAAGADVRAVWLVPGFADFGEDVPEAAPGSGPVMSLLRELDAGLPPRAALTVLTPRMMQGVDGGRVMLRREVNWRVLAGDMAARAAPDLALRLIVRADAGDARLRWFSAVAAALEAAIAVEPLAAALPERKAGDVLIWLGEGALPASVQSWVADGGAALVMADANVAGASVVVWRAADGAIAERFGAGFGAGVVRIVRPLTAAAMPALLEPDFPMRLRALMWPVPAPERALAEAVQPAFGGGLLAAAGGLEGVDLREWLAVVIGLLWLVERWMATRAGRMGAA